MCITFTGGSHLSRRGCSQVVHHTNNFQSACSVRQQPESSLRSKFTATLSSTTKDLCSARSMIWTKEHTALHCNYALQAFLWTMGAAFRASGTFHLYMHTLTSPSEIISSLVGKLFMRSRFSMTSYMWACVGQRLLLWQGSYWCEIRVRRERETVKLITRFIK